VHLGAGRRRGAAETIRIALTLVRAGIMIGEEQAISDVEQRETRREIKAGVLRSTDGTRAREPFWGRQRQSSAPVGYGPC